MDEIEWSPKQIKERYHNHIKPGILHHEWSLEDDLELIGYLNQHGKDWVGAARVLGGRSLNQVKNRYYGRLKKLNEAKIAAASKQLA